MILSTINNLKQLNDITYQNFISNESPLSIPFDAKAAYIIDTSDYANLRNVIQSEEHNIESYLLQIAQSQGHSTLEELIQSKMSSLFPLIETYAPIEGVDYLFFPSNRKAFINTFFSNIIPSLSDTLFEFLLNNNVITKIGTGLGKAYIIKCQELTQTHFDLFPTNAHLENVSPLVTDLMQNLNSTIANLQTAYDQSLVNQQFYDNQIALRDQRIEQLVLKVAELENKLYNAYQTTWR